MPETEVEDPFFSEEQTELRKARLARLVAEVRDFGTRPGSFDESQEKYNLFDDVLAQLRHGGLSRTEQHAQLERILTFSRQGGNSQ